LQVTFLDFDSIKKLPLLKDYDASEWIQFHQASEICRAALSERGYRRIDTPIIERTELFLRKSGGELAAQLYSFTDPGGYEVSLRPEFTAPVIRHVIEAGLLEQTPLRCEYSGPVFRYPSGDEFNNGMSGSFTQTGAELIGAGGPEADGEVISIALQGLHLLGVDHPGVALGHVGIIWDLLKQMDLSERAQLFLINCVPMLAAGDREIVAERASQIGLLEVGNIASARANRARASVEQIDAVLGHSLGSSYSGSLGQRSTDDVLQRLTDKIRAQDSPEAVNKAIELLSKLSKVSGVPSEAIAQAREVVKASGLNDENLGLLEDIVAATESAGASSSEITLDMGLAREIAYYTGVVFDLKSGDDEVVGGGGRYDGLVTALGGDRETPAAGFAYNLDRVIAHSETLTNG
jgi:histidyl-tRNA synthetase